jgi:carbamoyl-phosphate synthase large subunit
LDEKIVPHVGVKTPQFSFMQVDGADPILGVEMKSTGEAACLGENFYEALLLAYAAVGLKMIKPNPGGNVLVSVGSDEERESIEPLIRQLLWLGFNIYSTPGTAKYFNSRGLNVKVLYKISERREPNVLSYIVNRKLDLIINIPGTDRMESFQSILDDEYAIRRKAVEMGIPVITVPRVLEEIVRGMRMVKEFSIKSLQEYHQLSITKKF